MLLTGAVDPRMRRLIGLGEQWKARLPGEKTAKGIRAEGTAETKTQRDTGDLKADQWSRGLKGRQRQSRLRKEGLGNYKRASTVSDPLRQAMGSH